MASQEISYATINEALFQSFPLLKTKCVSEIIGFDYEKELPPPYVVFGNIFGSIFWVPIFFITQAEIARNSVESQRPSVFLEAVA